jgi:ATP-binding protein involved in chromosome partitioning
MQELNSYPKQFIHHDSLCEWLNQFHHSSLIENWATVSGLVRCTQDPSGTAILPMVTIVLPFAASGLRADLLSWISTQQQLGAGSLHQFVVTISVQSLTTAVESKLTSVKNVIAVTSAKGGVGKSTTAVNLALALAQAGVNVGLLDADIYGPSVPMMLGCIDAKPEVLDGKWMQPVIAHGLKSNSIGYLVDSSDAAIWRGPMASKALGQLLNETHWGSLDYLVIDMPPGTGDLQLTLAQQIPVTGAVVVTTPQDLSLADARKGVAMFTKVDVPVIGLVENMSYHICRHCGEKEAIFGVGGATTLAAEYQLTVLGQIPLDIIVREDIDCGTPTVVRRPDSPQAQLYNEMAEAVVSHMYWTGQVRPQAIPFTLVD